MKLAAIILVLLGAATETLAHYRFSRLILNGAVQPEWKFIRQWDFHHYNSPIFNLNHPEIRCNRGSYPSGDVAQVAAGSTVGFYVDQPIAHAGPYAAYMARAPSDVTRWDGNGNWFKIWEKGPTSISKNAITWDIQNRQWTFSIPRNTPNGQYLLRFEHIGLHEAEFVGRAQFYMSCAQINVVGGGNGNPGPTIRMPGGISPTHPGLHINIYWPIPTSYQIPGPRVWRG